MATPEAPPEAATPAAAMPEARPDAGAAAGHARPPAHAAGEDRPAAVPAPGADDGAAGVFCRDRYDRRKVLYHPRAIAEILETGDTWPVTVNTGFTTYCNHSCAWCSSAYTTRRPVTTKRRDELVIDPDVWRRNVAILAERGTRGLIIAGQGEPLLHPDARGMLAFAAGRGLRYMLFTNGERMGAKYVDTLLAGAVAVRFSVDAATPEMHRRVPAAANAQGRGRADFGRVVENIRRLVAEKRRRGLALPDIGCQMICSSLTEPDFEGFARLFRDIGVDYVVYKRSSATRAPPASRSRPWTSTATRPSGRPRPGGWCPASPRSAAATPARASPSTSRSTRSPGPTSAASTGPSATTAAGPIRWCR